jgi:hypothetical protein
MRNLIVTALAALTLSGCSCSTIREGNFGLRQSMFTAAYDHYPLPSGFNMAWFGDVHEYYGREVLIQVDDIHPKDKSNILLKDLDLVVTFQIRRDKAADYLIKTSDAVTKDGTVLLGTQRVDRAARQAIGPSVRHFESIEILNDPSQLQTQFKADLQSSLDKDYGKDVIEVIDVKVANILVSDVIESRIQSASVLAAEKAKNEATMAVLASRQATLAQEAKVLKAAADAGGITVDQLLQSELLKVWREGAKADVVIPVKK